jgi:hypothetical protein
MRRIITPSRSPSRDRTVDLVLDDFGEFGRASRETAPTRADRQTVVADLVSGQYERPLLIVALDTAGGWARDVTAEIAQEALVHAGELDHELSLAVHDFVERTA